MKRQISRACFAIRRSLVVDLPTTDRLCGAGHIADLRVAECANVTNDNRYVKKIGYVGLVSVLLLRAASTLDVVRQRSVFC